MTDYIIQKPATSAAEWDDYSLSVCQDIMANPGTTLGEIITRTGLASALTDRVVTSLGASGSALRAYDTKGNQFIWDPGAFGMLVMNNMNNARTWLESHDGDTVSLMATQLGLHEAVAIKIAFTMKAESDAKLTPV